MTTETEPVETKRPALRRPDRPPSARQLGVLRFIAERARLDLPAPTFAEIGAACGITSKNVVSHCVYGLIGRGLIVSGSFGVPRSLRATDKARHDFPDLFPPSPAERVMVAVQDARDAGEPLPERVVAAFEAVA